MMYISGKEVSSALAILRIEFQSSVGSNEHYVTDLSSCLHLTFSFTAV